jgi:hypothetical protein
MSLNNSQWIRLALEQANKHGSAWFSDQPRYRRSRASGLRAVLKLINR